MWLFFLTWLSFAPAPVMADPTCLVQFQDFLTELTFAPKTMVDFDAYENEIKNHLKLQTNAQLEDLVQKYIDHQLETKKYLPGLGKWPARTVDDFKENYKKTFLLKKDMSEYFMSNYASTVNSPVKTAKTFLTRPSAAPPPALFLNHYIQSVREGLTLTEFQTRLEAGLLTH
jgi:hypothetical protein